MDSHGHGHSWLKIIMSNMDDLVDHTHGWPQETLLNLVKHTHVYDHGKPWLAMVISTMDDHVQPWPSTMLTHGHLTRGWPTWTMTINHGWPWLCQPSLTMGKHDHDHDWPQLTMVDDELPESFHPGWSW